MTEMIDSGEIDGDTPPKVAYGKDPIFLQYSLTAFWAGLNKAKTERGMFLRPPAATGIPPVMAAAQLAINKKGK